MAASAQRRVNKDAVRANIEEFDGFAEQDGLMARPGVGSRESGVENSGLATRDSGFGFIKVIAIIHRSSFSPLLDPGLFFPTPYSLLPTP